MISETSPRSVDAHFIVGAVIRRRRTAGNCPIRIGNAIVQNCHRTDRASGHTQVIVGYGDDGVLRVALETYEGGLPAVVASERVSPREAASKLQALELAGYRLIDVSNNPV